MKIINLVENTPGPSGCGAEHGLSFYIETNCHKILMDTGASDLFLKNAEKLDIDLTAVDTVVLSHGHYDHGGGLEAFRAINPSALIYMQAAACGDYRSLAEDPENPRYIGLSENAKTLPGIIFVPPVGELKIDGELSIFGGIKTKHPVPAGNKKLKMQTPEGLEEDSFDHEQCLVVREGKYSVLFSGCAHHGILNVMDRYKELYGTDPTHVISGFHMMSHSGFTDDDKQLIIDTALALKQFNTIFYTGHCTGEIPFEAMKKIMEDQLLYVHSGDEIHLAALTPAKQNPLRTGNATKKKGKRPMKWHRFFAWATVTSFFLTMITGYKHK